MNATDSHDDIAARLYLQAVLPAFEELPEVSPRARALVAGWDCAVEFAVFGRGGAAVQFQGGKVSVLAERCRKAAISLFFISSRQLVKQFDGEGLSLPLPRRGILRLASLLRFQRLGKILEEELEQQPRLMLSVALGSLRPLITHDHKSRELMRDCPEGLAEFCVPSLDLAGWTEWRAGAVKWGRGRAPRAADVVVSFQNETTALAALRGELDEQAAIGMGELTVRGLVPLAETLGLVMARADRYVKRRGNSGVIWSEGQYVGARSGPLSPASERGRELERGGAYFANPAPRYSPPRPLTPTLSPDGGEGDGHSLRDPRCKSDPENSKK